MSIFFIVMKLQGLAPTKFPGTTFLTILITYYLPCFWKDPCLELELRGAKGEWKHNSPRKHVAPSMIIPATNTSFLPSYQFIVSYSRRQWEYRSALYIATCKQLTARAFSVPVSSAPKTLAPCRATTGGDDGCRVPRCSIIHPWIGPGTHMHTLAPSITLAG